MNFQNVVMRLKIFILCGLNFRSHEYIFTLFNVRNSEGYLQFLDYYIIFFPAEEKDFIYISVYKYTRQRASVSYPRNMRGFLTFQASLKRLFLPDQYIMLLNIEIVCLERSQHGHPK